MDVTFSAAEAYDLAEQIEKRFADFYMAAADHVESGPLSALFAELAQTETGHVQVFQAIRETLYHAQSSGRCKVNVDKYWPFISSSITDIQSDLATFFATRKTPQDILRGAMAIERDSLMFFLRLKDLVVSNTEKARVGDIAKEEMGHLIALGSQLSKL